MKKVSLFLGIVLAASFAMAQNTSDTKQIGDGNQISVEQTGTGNLVGRVATGPTGGAAVTYSSQTGDNNQATVTQEGTSNTAFFEQGVSYKTSTLPYGGALTGDGNIITIDQSGIKNLAWGYSLGNENHVIVTQAGDGTVDAINQAGHWLWGNGNHATQSQTGGIGNYAYSAANSSGNTSNITQIGGTNQGTTSQGWIGYAGMDGNTATIYQKGESNIVSLPSIFVLSGYTSDLYGKGIQQYGAGNEGTVNQGTELQAANSNNAAIWQFGDDNTGTINQYSSFNTAYLIQLGASNDASITQEDGTGNVVNLKQTDDAEATILQHGTGNVVKGIGLDEMATSFDGSFLDVEQWGTTNTLNLQQADGASATVYQNGTSNVATVIQNAN